MMEQTPVKVPRSRVERTHAALRDELLQAIEPVLIGSPSEAGPRLRRRLEGRFADAVGQSFAYGAHSGAIGLVLALRACGVGPGDEVITVANSDVSTTAAISHAGAVPVLVDVLATDFTIDPTLVEPAITERTAAILPVDLYGHPADVKRLRAIADRHGLKIVEDAALAIGAEDHGRPVGAFADVTVFSFAPFKPLGCLGNGAMVTTDDEQIARRVRLLGGYGQAEDATIDVPGHQCHLVEGYNVPLDPLQAAILSVKLPYLAAWTARRRALAAAYARGLADLPVTLPAWRPESSPTFRSYVIRVDDQQRIYHGLRRAGVEAVLHYVPPISRQPVYAGGLRGADRVPVTELVARQLVCLPVAAELDDADVQYVVETLAGLLGGERVEAPS